MEGQYLMPRSGIRLPHRRSKSQRDRQRAGLSPANSSSSSPETAHCPHPPRKRRKRKGVIAPVREEDLIDGFCISSYGSLEAMQRDTSLDSALRAESGQELPANKRKRSDGASTDDPEASALQIRTPTLSTPKHRKRHKEQKRHCPLHKKSDRCVQRVGPAQGASLDPQRCCLDAGYICDAESSCDEQVLGDGLAVSFTVSISSASPPPSGGRLKLLVLPQISGISRSCERIEEPGCDAIVPVLCRSPPRLRTSCLLPPSVPRLSPKAEQSPGQRLTPAAPDLSHSSSSRSSVSKPVSAPHVSPQPTAPSLALSGHSVTNALPHSLRPHSHPHIGLFAPSSGLPPPPPLLQVTGHPSSTVTAVLSEHDVIGQALGARFLAAPGGGAELSTAIRPMYQFHQHNHQHTHQHTHQHFTPYPPNVGANTFEKYPGKIENLYKQTFFPSYAPVISALSPVLPPNVSFGSHQGAFQPKSTNSELASRCAVPPGLGHKPPQLSDQFKHRRSGRWCAMHVRVAYMILRHQERLKLAQGTHKCDFPSDVLSCLPSGLGSFSSAQELARSSSFFTGVASLAPSTYRVTPPVTTTLLPPADPFYRTSGFSSMMNGAFGGLGSPPYNAIAMFNQKESPSMDSFSNPHDPWTRLHRTPPSFPTASSQACPRIGDVDPHASILIKDEKDRSFLFTRLGMSSSSLTPLQRLPGGDERGPSRNISPYVGIRPGSSSETKPHLTPDHPAKVKEDPEVLTFEVGHSSHPGLHLSPALERFRGAFIGEQFPHALETWRDMYRRADPSPGRFPQAPPHRLYEQREERAHILREDFERARIYGLSTRVTATPTMLGSLHSHPSAGLLRKTPPVNLLSAPPPLVSSSRPGSPPQRRDFYKERDSR